MQPTNPISKKPVAIISRADGIKIEALNLYLQRQDLYSGPLHSAETQIGLPLASGVIVHFAKMKSFEIFLVKRATKPSTWESNVEDWDTEATITLLDGTTIKEKLVYRSHLAELRGGHTLGSFQIAIRDTKRVDFEW